MEVGNPASPETTETLGLFLDSGIVHAVVPRPVLDRLGIKVIGDISVRLGDGTRLTRKTGVALFRYGKRTGDGDVV
ncbi:MAG: hypothetical protein ACYDH9_24220 [Limisphaerales bacterium]